MLGWNNRVMVIIDYDPHLSTQSEVAHEAGLVQINGEVAVTFVPGEVDTEDGESFGRENSEG